MNLTGFYIYLIFIVSWFLHLGNRIVFLGIIRFDLILVCCLTIIAFLSAQENETKKFETNTDKYIKMLILFIIISTPLTEWPGTAFRFGIPNLIKALAFYYFTNHYMINEKRLKIFLIVFVACQSFRVMEPLYLHLTQGYWGSIAYYDQGGAFMERLSGSPMDVINPNGLAFVIDTIIPFLFFLSVYSKRWMIISLILSPLLIYALVLTGSRSGIIGLLVLLLSILIKSKRKLIVGIVFIIGASILVLNLTPDQKDRYFSIFDTKSKYASSVDGRIQGVKQNLAVAMRRPLLGHGLGSSLEANFNYLGSAQPAHNLYIEIAEEIGFIGLIIFLFFIKSIFANFIQVGKDMNNLRHIQKSFLFNMNNAMQVWLVMNFVFSFASYGLTSYEWYLFGGFSNVLRRLASNADYET